MKIINLGSGSKGNATLIKIKSGYILIDCGLSNLLKLLEKNNINISDIKYLFVTHNHIDHIKNIESFDNKIVYTGKYTIDIPHNNLEYYQKYDFGEFKVDVLRTFHDAPNPMGFIFYINDSELVYITDTGKIPAKTQHLIKNKEFYILEFNHDVDMLMNSSRPIQLKARILSDCGHLSNQQALEYVKKLVGNKTKGIAAAHLSEECNNPLKIPAVLKDFPNINILKLKQWEITEISYDED